MNRTIFLFLINKIKILFQLNFDTFNRNIPFFDYVCTRRFILLPTATNKVFLNFTKLLCKSFIYHFEKCTNLSDLCHSLNLRKNGVWKYWACFDFDWSHLVERWCCTLIFKAHKNAFFSHKNLSEKLSDKILEYDVQVQKSHREFN